MSVLLNLISGIALLAFGIHIIKSGVLRSCGSSLNYFLSRSLTSKFWPLKAALSGLFITALVQSSNATAMLIAAFLSKGVIALTPALTIMLGANLGSAVMARVLTFDLSLISPILITSGVFLFLSKRKSKAGKIGRILVGLGLVLMSLKLIVMSTSPVVKSETVSLILQSLNGEILLALIFGALLAVICYSSLAAVLLTGIIALTGQLSLETALCLVIGANLGSCLLEILGASGQGIEAKRVMFGNTLFKLTIALLILPFISKLAKLETGLAENEFIIWFHVAFNIIACIVLMPFVPLYSKLLILWFPKPETAESNEAKPLYLDENTWDNHALAVSNAVREVLRLGGYLHEMLMYLKDGVTGKSKIKDKVEHKYNNISELSAATRNYLDGVEFDESDDIAPRWHQVFSAVISTVHAADIIRRMQGEVEALNADPVKNISAKSRSDLLKLINAVNENLAFALNALMTGKSHDSEIIYTKKSDFKTMTDNCSVRELNNLSLESQYNDSDLGALSILLISDLRQLNGIICSIAISRFATLQMQKRLQHEKTIIKKED